ncbi:hypothetical protein C1T30_43735, partial [Bacillus sp. MBGLi97]
TSKIILIIITFILQLKTQQLPQHLIFNTTKQYHQTMKHLQTVNKTHRTTTSATAKTITIETKQIFNDTTITKIAPTQA